MPVCLIVTAEHAGNRVPAPYAKLFRGKQRVLNSHRGYDPDSLDLARYFARRFDAPLFFNTITRLLVEANRSPHHPSLFSKFSASLNDDEKLAILQRYYHPHRNRVEVAVAQRIGGGNTVLHLSMHTFTPVLRGETRRADIGLLYDPSRRIEREFSGLWQDTLRRLRPDLRVRRNYPYRGTADGFTTHLRQRFSADRYAGVELEVNQLWTRKKPAVWRGLIRDLAKAFAAAYDAGN